MTNDLIERLKDTPYTINEWSDENKNNKELVIEAIKINLMIFGFIPDTLVLDPEVQRVAFECASDDITGLLDETIRETILQAEIRNHKYDNPYHSIYPYLQDINDYINKIEHCMKEVYKLCKFNDLNEHNDNDDSNENIEIDN